MTSSFFIPSQGQPNAYAAGPAVIEDEGERLPILRQYLHMLVRRKWLVAAIIALCLGAGILLTLTATKLYTATSRIEIARQGKQISGVNGIESEVSTYDTEFYNTQYSLLKARSLASRVVATLRLDRDEAFFAAHGVDPEDLNASGGGSAKLAKVAEDLLLGTIQITPVRGSSLVDISDTSADPVVSAKIANAWAEQFIAESVANRYASTADARQFLEQRLDNLRQRLEQSERDLVNYARDNQIVMLLADESQDGRTRTVRTLATSNLETINQQLAQATADRIQAEALARNGGTARQFSLQSAGLASLRNQRADLAAQYQRMLVQFEPGYPAARELKAQIDALDASIAREESRVSSTFSGQLAEARAREAALADRAAALRGQLDRERDSSIQYGIYQREVDTNRQLYDTFLQRYKEIGVAGVDATNISIVDRALVPENPSSPNLMLNLIIALLVGTALAGVTVLVLEHVDEGLRVPADVNRELGIPLLGAVFDAEDLDNDLKDRKSMVSEAYASVRSMLAVSTQHGLPRSMMTCSTGPGEGKTTTAIALALSLARNGRRVVLVDGDLRAATIHSRLGVPNEVGLANILAGSGDESAVVSSTLFEGVDVLPAGPYPPNPSDLLAGPAMEALIVRLQQIYDCVVVDSPPTLGLADAVTIGRLVEGVVFVVQAKRDPIRAIRAAIARLKNAQVHVLGAVVTKLDPTDIDISYGYGYGYGHAYGHEDGKAKSLEAAE